MDLLLTFLAVAFLATPLSAQSTSTSKGTPSGVEAYKKARTEFENRLRLEREEFYKEQKAERERFKAGLRGKDREEKKSLLAEFTLKQKEKLKRFREGQRAKRREFQESGGRILPMKKKFPKTEKEADLR